MSKFEQASRMKLRFLSIRGELTTEQLWDLPLQSKNSFDLDTIAKDVNRDIKNMGEESFVTTSDTSPAKIRAELRLAILKHIIAVKLKEAEDAKNAAARKAERDRLIAILGDKQEADLRGLSAEEIQKRINELS